MNYLDVRKKKSQNESEEDIDREYKWDQTNPLWKWKCKMIFYCLHLRLKDYWKNENEGKKDEELWKQKEEKKR